MLGLRCCNISGLTVFAEARARSLDLSPPHALPTRMEDGTSHSTVIPVTTLDEQGVADLFTQLGFPFYRDQLAGKSLPVVPLNYIRRLTVSNTLLAEHGITGEVLIHLDHESLKDIGVHSVGQRLAILRAVYQLKVQQSVPIEASHYVPPCERELGLDRVDQADPSLARAH